MIVFRYYIVRSNSKRTINKFVIIRISRNNTKSKMRVNIFHITAIEQKHNHILSYLRCSLLLYDFLILIQNLITNTKHIPFSKKSIPNWTIWTMLREHLYEAVCVDYDRNISFHYL